MADAQGAQGEEGAPAQDRAGQPAGALVLSGDGSDSYAASDPLREHPETYVGAAFALGFVLARILRRVAP